MPKGDIGFEFTLVDNSDLVKKACREQIIKALEAVGIQAESDIKAAMSETWPQTGTDIVNTSALQNSISHEVFGDSQELQVGSNKEYAVYVHEGTGEYAINGGTPKKRWVYQDKATGQYRIGTPQKPRRFIKETIEKNINDYKEIIKEYLSK